MIGNLAIDEFVSTLRFTQNCFENSENLYAESYFNSAITINNLRAYLYKMAELSPKYLLVGEAPGYKGCRLSGIPFTSERIIADNEFFQNSFLVRDIKKTETEASATIVWNYLSKINLYPLMWNAYPFHPFIKANLLSNRTPSKKELEYGIEILFNLISIYNIEKENIIAIGKKAYSILENYGIKKIVRHPANGGKKEFSDGLDSFLVNT